MELFTPAVLPGMLLSSSSADGPQPLHGPTACFVCTRHWDETAPGPVGEGWRGLESRRRHDLFIAGQPGETGIALLRVLERMFPNVEPACLHLAVREARVGHMADTPVLCTSCDSALHTGLQHIEQLQSMARYPTFGS